jgi:hypothetical protein
MGPRCAALALAVALSSGCGGPRQQPIGAELKDMCPSERLQVCTMEYAPVCAFLEDGSRKEFASGCVACSKPQVTGYISGPCP